MAYVEREQTHNFGGMYVSAVKQVQFLLVFVYLMKHYWSFTHSLSSVLM